MCSRLFPQFLVFRGSEWSTCLREHSNERTKGINETWANSKLPPLNLGQKRSKTQLVYLEILSVYGRAGGTSSPYS